MPQNNLREGIATPIEPGLLGPFGGFDGYLGGRFARSNTEILLELFIDSISVLVVNLAFANNRSR